MATKKRYIVCRPRRNVERNGMQINLNRSLGIETVLFYVSQCLPWSFCYILSMFLSLFLTPTLWQMVPHKSHTQISSQGNASLLLKRGTNVRWIWDEFALWIKFTVPRWLFPRVYQETATLLYFISYNSERIFLHSCDIGMQSWAKCDAATVRLLNT